MDWQERISVDPKVLVGKPVIAGTRIAVEFVVELLAEGWTTEEVWPIAINLQHWPGQVHNIMGQGARHERRRLFDV
ncbi:MAG: DUF433 domain-containing protein, partial [Planctomycetes bacterium]|nr:DUF433 domain-containing protein [Planctomycetota bacterium]